MIPSSDVASLGAQLSEVLNRFNELNVEMATQRCVIDQLVSSSHSGIQTYHMPNDNNQPESDNQPTHMSTIPTTFVPTFTNLQGGAFTYFNHNLLQAHSTNVQIL